ncbi:MAG: hypothetical protein Q8880_06745 [Bacteroidota bacterium]|nr:hypothetical protein [Bacteroidota bacterium]
MKKNIRSYFLRICLYKLALTISFLFILMHSDYAFNYTKKLKTDSINSYTTGSNKNKPNQPEDYNNEGSLNNYFKGLSYGLYFGVYFPNAATASYYNGATDNMLQRVLIDDAINKAKIMQTPQLNNSDFEISSDGYPTKMAYNSAINVGFVLKYGLSINTGIFAEMNYTKLKATDAFTITLLNQPPSMYSAVQIGALTGTERRTDINIGLRQNFGDPYFIMPYAEISFNINSTRVLTSEASINGLTFDISNHQYDPTNPQSPYNANYNTYIGGIGYGFNIGGGLQFIFNEKYSFDLGATYSRKQINIPVYNDKLLSQYNVYLRIMMHNVSKKSEDTAN